MLLQAESGWFRPENDLIIAWLNSMAGTSGSVSLQAILRVYLLFDIIRAGLLIETEKADRR